MGRSGIGQLSRYVGVYVAFSVICAALVVVRPINFLSDDGLFYLVIAQHIANGQGSTFNGLFPTNGYHPLWECIATGLALLPLDKHSLLVAGVLTQLGLNIVTFVLVLKALPKSLSVDAVGAFCAVLLFLFVPFGNLFWTEAPVSMLCVAAVFYLLQSPTSPSYVTLGILLGLTFLGRLDNVFFIGCVFAGLWWRDRDLRLGVACLVAAAIAGTYLLTNVINFGHVMPISGAIKSAVYRQHYFAGQLGAYGLLALAGGIALAALSIAQRSFPERYRLASLMLSAGVILHGLYVWALTYGDTAWVWYYVQGFLCVALLAAQSVETLKSRVPFNLGRVLFITSVGLSVAIAVAKFSINWSWHDPRALAGHWKEAWMAEIRRVLPNDNSVLVVLDQPGLFAYSLSHPVFALDGLTMNHEFDKALATRGMNAQLQTFGTSYFVAPVVAADAEFRVSVLAQHGVPGGQIVHFFTPLSGADAGCIRIDDSALITRRAVPAMIAGGVWGVWKLNAATVHAVPCPADM
jgi:hypothetical protein